MNNERSLHWALVLYPSEDPTHKLALDYILENYSKYAYICHDKDILDDGSTKKVHYHIVVSFSNYRWRNAIAEELKITPNYLEKIRNLENALKYLIHYNNSNKYQYAIDDVHGTLKQKLEAYINTQDKTESEKVLELLCYIEETSTFLKLSDFIRFVCNNNMYDIYRRSATTFVKLIEEHNVNFYRKR